VHIRLYRDEGGDAPRYAARFGHVEEYSLSPTARIFDYEELRRESVRLGSAIPAETEWSRPWKMFSFSPIPIC
jgi:hypothetical protein